MTTTFTGRPENDHPVLRGFILLSRPDKEWPLTDCISFVVMRRYDIVDALTADHHFEQAGFNLLLK
jgi:predicted nucleic acid-binding protein